jgi:hypothetical protein
MACSRLFTVFPLPPLFSVPFLRLRIARSTERDAAVPYRGISMPSLPDRAARPGREHGWGWHQACQLRAGAK